MELGPLNIKKWDAGEKNGEIGQFLAELVFWLSCKISFFTISNHTNGAADMNQMCTRKLKSWLHLCQILKEMNMISLVSFAFLVHVLM